MRVLAIHRYFWPDTPPYASMLRAIAQRWAIDGHDVEVLTSQPSYKAGVTLPRQLSNEELDGFKVKRVHLLREAGRAKFFRVANMLLFSAAIITHVAFNRRYDAIMVSTAPPVILAAATRWAARLKRSKFIYHCMDIHPEIGRISGEFRNQAIFSWLRWIDSHNCRRATRVVVLSQDMAHSVRKRNNSNDLSIQIINNFDLPVFGSGQEVTLPRAMQKEEGCFRILFAGNVGRFQGLEFVIEGMRLLRRSTKSDAELIIMGEGNALNSLKKSASDLAGNWVKFFPHQSIEMARKMVKTADLCLVTLQPEIYKYAYPSKTMSYLSEGRPLLALIEPESELGRMVNERNVGLVVPQGDAEAFAQLLTKVIGDSSLNLQMAKNAKETWHKYFRKEAVLDQWSKLLNDLGEVIRK